MRKPGPRKPSRRSQNLGERVRLTLEWTSGSEGSVRGMRVMVSEDMADGNGRKAPSATVSHRYLITVNKNNYCSLWKLKKWISFFKISEITRIVPMGHPRRFFGSVLGALVSEGCPCPAGWRLGLASFAR